jgi:hypothetical protein
MLHTTTDPHPLLLALEQAHFQSFGLKPARGRLLLLLIRRLAGMNARLADLLWCMNHTPKRA